MARRARVMLRGEPNGGSFPTMKNILFPAALIAAIAIPTVALADGNDQKPAASTPAKEAKETKGKAKAKAKATPKTAAKPPAKAPAKPKEKEAQHG